MAAMPRASVSPADLLPHSLRRDIERAGYYPALVADVVAEAVAGEDVVEHLVHQETTFDHEEILRHLTVLVLTRSRLVVGHVDDHLEMHAEPGVPRTGRAGERPPGAGDPVVMATSESVPLASVRGVMLTHVVGSAAAYRPGTLGSEVTVTLGWGAVSRIDLPPASCADPACEGDHGYDGTVTSDDISFRVSADADGPEAVQQARAFARALSLATGR
ncbi:DUF5998 family protein [Arsenicicoccus dermatophilus]|uniref:DUF5998 family protein n=1 Tax=Arsenicicoccus dermatophilus TaxID=1076331 RepID=UPI00389223E1